MSDGFLTDYQIMGNDSGDGNKYGITIYSSSVSSLVLSSMLISVDSGILEKVNNF